MSYLHSQFVQPHFLILGFLPTVVQNYSFFLRQVGLLSWSIKNSEDDHTYLNDERSILGTRDNHY